MKPLEAEGLAVGVVERRKPEIKWRRTKTVLSPETLMFCVHRGDFRFYVIALKMARVFLFLPCAEKRVARAARGASLCQEKPGVQPDVVPELEAVAFYYCFALTEDVSVRGCMRASGSKVAKANAADNLTIEAAPSLPLCLPPPARRHGGAP